MTNKNSFVHQQSGIVNLGIEENISHAKIAHDKTSTGECATQHNKNTIQAVFAVCVLPLRWFSSPEIQWCCLWVLERIQVTLMHHFDALQ